MAKKHSQQEVERLQKEQRELALMQAEQAYIKKMHAACLISGALFLIALLILIIVVLHR